MLPVAFPSLHDINIFLLWVSVFLNMHEINWLSSPFALFSWIMMSSSNIDFYFLFPSLTLTIFSSFKILTYFFNSSLDFHLDFVSQGLLLNFDFDVGTELVQNRDKVISALGKRACTTDDLQPTSNFCINIELGSLSRFSFIYNFKFFQLIGLQCIYYLVSGSQLLS